MPELPIQRKLRFRIFVSTVEIHCPFCERPISAPDGSILWDVDDIPDEIICKNCKTTTIKGKRLDIH